MDVKELKPLGRDNKVVKQTQEQGSRQPAASLIAKVRTPEVSSDSVALSNAAPSKSNSKDSIKLRESANRAINLVNSASETTSDLDALVKSLGGILEQASSQELSPNRKSALESEANQLVSKIKEVANNSATTSPISSDAENDIKVEIERRLGRSLEAILPDEVKNGFGIGPVSLSQKETIINTLTQVQAARSRIEELRGTVDTARQAVSNVVTSLEVASQNSEAAQSSLRDLDQAVELASQARFEISEDPEAALDSLGPLERRAPTLLE